MGTYKFKSLFQLTPGKDLTAVDFKKASIIILKL